MFFCYTPVCIKIFSTSKFLHLMFSHKSSFKLILKFKRIYLYLLYIFSIFLHYNLKQFFLIYCSLSLSLSYNANGFIHFSNFLLCLFFAFYVPIIPIYLFLCKHTFYIFRLVYVNLRSLFTSIY